MKLRDFLEQVAFVCTEDKVLAKRIAKDMLLKYDYEINSPDSCFAMKPQDFEVPRERIELLFTSKYMKKVDKKKMQRAEDIVYLLSLYEYQNKYKTDKYAEEIQTVQKYIEAEPVKEVDSLMSVEVAARGFWSD